MSILRHLIRASGVLLGALLLLTVLADALGMAPQSGITGTLAQRLATAAPIVLAALLLLLPYRRLGARVQALGALGLGVLALVLVYLAYRSVQAALAGDLHWAAIPASLVILAVVAGNALILGAARRQRIAAAA